MNQFTIFLFLIFVFTGCGDKNDMIESSSPDEDKKNLVIISKIEDLSKKLDRIDDLQDRLDKIESSINNADVTSQDDLSHSGSEKITSIAKTESNLHDASAIGDILRVSELLKSGSDPNMLDENGRTPLHYAASNGRVEIIIDLIKSGANVNALDNEKMTPLNRAQFIGSMPAIKILQENDAIASKIINPENAANKPTSTTEEILNAIEADALDLYKKQESLGFDINILLPNGKTIIETCAVNGSYEILNHILGGEENISDRNSDHLIINSIISMNQRLVGEGQDIVSNKFIRVIKLLSKTFPNSVNCVKDGYAPLHMAISTHDITLLELLLDANADIELMASNKRTPLILAITTPDDHHHSDNYHDHVSGDSHGHQLDMAKMLIDKGANVNRKGFKGRNAIMEAIKIGNTKLALSILNLGGDPKSSDEDGVTCLHLASYYGSRELCEKLLSLGADKNKKVLSGPKLGLLPVDAARDGNHSDLVKYLEAN